VEAHRAVRGRGSYFFQIFGLQIAVRSALRAGRPLLPGRFLILISVRDRVDPQDHSVAGRIKTIERSNDLIENRRRYLPACSIVPQPTSLASSEEAVYNLMNCFNCWGLLALVWECCSVRGMSHVIAVHVLVWLPPTQPSCLVSFPSHDNIRFRLFMQISSSTSFLPSNGDVWELQ
jgi:hypothetical protein